MKEILNHLFDHNTLGKAAAKAVLTDIGSAKYNNSEIAAFLTVFQMRDITIEELGGFREALLDLCVRIDLSDFETIDMCGTGGDSKNTFNISTLSSFIVSGAGISVAKHGNYGVSSGCGSSNVIEHLGYTFTNDQDVLRKQLQDAGICFLHAPMFHPAMKNVGPVRREVGVKTFFNMLGPMVNPSFPQNQVVGVFNLELARMYNYLYQDIDRNYVILHALDGYDEISLTGDFKMIDRNRERVLSPSDLGMKKITQEEIHGGGTVEGAAKIFMSILEGKGTEAQNNAVIANSGMGIYCAKKNTSIEDALGYAKESLESGKALGALKKLMS
ncbi:MAG: anthranilate phosphoribosyltransferase [Flavobacteriales bacterium]|nr:anthranilate phosphoribosyltransferase [Flavobacteriales bacterium]